MGKDQKMTFNKVSSLILKLGLGHSERYSQDYKRPIELKHNPIFQKLCCSSISKFWVKFPKTEQQIYTPILIERKPREENLVNAYFAGEKTEPHKGKLSSARVTNSLSWKFLS